MWSPGQRSKSTDRTEMSILEVNNVSKSFGGVKANVDISMSVEKGKKYWYALYLAIK